MSDNVNVESTEVLSKRLLDAVTRAEDGMLKNASDAGTQMIRRRLRENGFSRLILPYKQVSEADLNYLPDTELPVIVEEMEPDSPGAKSIPFNDTADTAFIAVISLRCTSVRSPLPNSPRTLMSCAPTKTTFVK